jgi:hypothetical protein
MNEDTTQVEGQEPSTTAPEAPETFDREYVEKLRNEAAKYRTLAKERADAMKTAEAARLEQAPLEDRLKAIEAERDALAKQAEERTNDLRKERGMRQLATEVTDPEGALILATSLGLVDDDGNVNTKKLLEAKPYLAHQPARPAVKPLNPGTKAAVSMNDLIRQAAGR